MKKEFQISTGSPDDVSELAAFLKQEYPSGEIADNRFLEWEYLQGPFGKAVVALARDAQRVIASQYALVPIEVYADGNLIPASLSLNTLTGIAYRGKGLFAETAEATFLHCATSGIACTIGIPNKNSYPGFVNRLRFKHTGNLAFLVKPLRPFGILKGVIRSDKKKKGVEINFQVRSNVLNEKSISVFHPGQDKNQYEVFWSRWRSMNKLAVNRTAAYFSWRYFENPLRCYHVFKLAVDGEIKALIALRVLYVYGMRTCVVMDFMSLEDVHGHALLKAVCAEAKRNGLDILAAATTGRKTTYLEMKKAGFMAIPAFLLPQQLPFIIRFHKRIENMEMLIDLDNWHFTFGDYDIF